MSRRDNAPSVRIIGHKKYILEKRNMVCVFHTSDPKKLIDLRSKTTRLYYPQGKAFVLETTGDMSGHILETKVISKKEAEVFINAHPDGIIEKVYVRYFGEPEEI